jgi:hypothetical protein
MSESEKLDNLCYQEFKKITERPLGEQLDDKNNTFLEKLQQNHDEYWGHLWPEIHEIVHDLKLKLLQASREGKKCVNVPSEQILHDKRFIREEGVPKEFEKIGIKCEWQTNYSMDDHLTFRGWKLTW